MMPLTARAAAALLLVAVAVRAGGVRRVAPRQLTSRGTLRRDDARAAEIARAVHRASRMWRPSPSCLTRALAIGRLLSREGLEARMTIGVATDPFGAHAWLSHGPIVLAGEAALREYVPLCRIEAGPRPAFTSF